MVNDFMGNNGFIWFVGIVENRMDPLKTGRTQVRKFAWDTSSKALLPTQQLLWAHPILPLNNDKVQPPKEGTMVFGFFMDGIQAQNPMLLGQIPGIPDTQLDPTQGFSDPRTNDQLQNAPRPPQTVNYNTSGSGATITEAPNANRNPQYLNEPTNPRIGRNENISDTIVQQKINSTVNNVPVATGGLQVPGIDLNAFINAQINLGIVIPPFSVMFNKTFGFEICGIGIGLNLAAGFSFGGIALGLPTIGINGQIFLGGIPINILLAGLAAIGGAVTLAIDIAGCLLAGTKIGNEILIDGGILLPLLQPGAIINFSLINPIGTIFGGVSLGTMGGIPLSSPPMWNEPITPYNASYPYNQVLQTESGHVFEMDDTHEAERIHMFHRSGTFFEMHPNGNMVTKVTNNNFGITMADDNLNVMGSQHVTVNTNQSNMVQGNHTENINGTSTELINGNETHTVLGSETKTTALNYQHTITQQRYVDVKGTDNLVCEKDRNVTILGNCNLVVQGNCTLAVGGILNIGSTSDTDMTVGGNYNLTVTGAINITAQNTIINDPLIVNGPISATGEITRGSGTSDQVTLGQHIHGTGSTAAGTVIPTPGH